MSVDHDIAGIRDRIAKAEYDRDHSRMTGRQDQYLEACSRVKGLELDLDRMRKHKLEAAMKVPFSRADS